MLHTFCKTPAPPPDRLLVSHRMMSAQIPVATAVGERCSSTNTNNEWIVTERSKIASDDADGLAMFDILAEVYGIFLEVYHEWRGSCWRNKTVEYASSITAKLSAIIHHFNAISIDFRKRYMIRMFSADKQKSLLDNLIVTQFDMYSDYTSGGLMKWVRSRTKADAETKRLRLTQRKRVGVLWSQFEKMLE